MKNHELIGVKKNKKMTFNNVSLENLDPKDKAKAKALAVADAAGTEDEESSDDEILNAINTTNTAISLSVYNHKNLNKMKYQKEYYSTPSKMH